MRLSPSGRPPPPPLTHAFSEDMTEVEPLLQQGDWQQLVALLERREAEQPLPPHLGLLYAIALKEVEGLDTTGSGQRVSAEPIGIRAMAELLRVPEESAAALVVAKRVLRRRPLGWNRPPEKRVSILLILIALAFGAGVGLSFSQDLVDLFWK
jgi:hypothetical protein